MRFILASKSPSRLELLRRAGLDPEVHASDVDESLVTDSQPVRLALRLAAAKGESVAERVAGDAIFVACDSVLEFEGRAHGKPRSVEAAKVYCTRDISCWFAVTTRPDRHCVPRAQR